MAKARVSDRKIGKNPSRNTKAVMKSVPRAAVLKSQRAERRGSKAATTGGGG